MHYSLEDIWTQATEDDYAVEVNGDGYKARIVFGIKIVKDDETEEIIILNTMKGGDFYMPVLPEEINLFKEKGWRCGAYVISLSNYRTKLDKVEQSIKKEVNGRNSMKQLSILKSSRERILKRYAIINNKLNQLN